MKNKSKGKSPTKSLLEAVTAGDLAQVQALIKEGADLTECDEESPLSQAAELGRTDIVDVLLKAGADPNFGGIWVPVCGAVRSGNIATVERLLERKPKVDAQEEEGVTALMVAAGMGNLKMVEMLVGAGAGAKKKDNDGQTAIIYAKTFPQIIEFLKPLSTKADVKYLEKELSEPDEATEEFLAAVKGGNIAQVKSLLEKGVKLGALGKSGESALHAAVDGRNIEIIELLLQAGASPNVYNRDGCTPIFIAVGNRDPVLVERLLRAGADINAKSKPHGGTPFHSSVGDRQDDQDMMRLLARHGADVHAVDAYGRSALDTAGRYLGIKENDLSEEDRRLINGLRQTFVEIGVLHPESSRFTEAAAAGDLGTVRRFIESGVPANAVDEEERTALYMAISRGHPELVAYLLKAGADVHKPTGSDSGEDKWAGGFHKACPKCGNIFTALTCMWRCPKCSHEFKAQDIFDPDPDGELFMLWSNDHLPLVTAARLGDSEIITLLLDAGAEVDRGVGKITPLMYASYFGHLEAARILIARGANARAEAKTPDRSANKISASRFAAAHGHIELLKLLWDSGAPSKDRNSTLLVDAAGKNDVPTIQGLLAEGVDMNLPDPLTNKRPMEIAARNGNAEAVAALVGAGATIDFGRKLSPLWHTVYGFGNICDKERTPELIDRYVRVAKILLAAGARGKAALEWQTELKKCAPLVELIEAAWKK